MNDAVWERFKKKTEKPTPVDGPIIQELSVFESTEGLDDI